KYKKERLKGNAFLIQFKKIVSHCSNFIQGGVKIVAGLNKKNPYKIRWVWCQAGASSSFSSAVRIGPGMGTDLFSARFTNTCTKSPQAQACSSPSRKMPAP